MCPSQIAASAPAVSTRYPLALEDVLTDFLDDDELENLICVYLQNRFGYLVRAASDHVGLTRDDFVLRNVSHGDALVYVRHGHVPVPRDAVSLPTDAVDDVFVFSPTDTYGPDPAPNVSEIHREDLLEFIRSERWSLPLSVEEWVSRVLDDD